MNRVLVPLELPPVALADSEFSLQTLTGETMGTSWTVKFLAEPRDLQHEVQNELNLVVEQMSTWLPGSDLSQFNRAPVGAWQTLPSEFLAVLDNALRIANYTDGAYDPTVGPLVNLWGFGPEGQRHSPPSLEQIEWARTRCGWKFLERDGQRLRKSADIYLDLSSIAKGFGVDQVARLLEREGITNYLVEVGGELRGFGTKPDGSPWWIDIERPSSEKSETIVALHGLSVATSGDYRKYFEAEGLRYSHTIDPRTGYPVRHNVASVTVLHKECMIADAISTALTVLGVDEGMDYAIRQDFAALFIERTASGFREHMSPALAVMLN